MFCECGCGRKTNIATYNRPKYGWIKGKPIRFIHNHHHNGSRNHNFNNYKSKSRIYNIITMHGRVDGKHKFEHREIVEKIIGKPIPKRAVIHHVNGNGFDNRNCNLVVCDSLSYHSFIHQRTRAFNACGHASWRKCKFCKTYDNPINLHVKSNNAYHSSCAYDYNKKRELFKKAQQEVEQ